MLSFNANTPGKLHGLGKVGSSVRVQHFISLTVALFSGTLVLCTKHHFHQTCSAFISAYSATTQTDSYLNVPILHRPREECGKQPKEASPEPTSASPSQLRSFSRQQLTCFL